MTKFPRDISTDISESHGTEEGGNSHFLFISLFSLILAFFILLYSQAEISEKKAGEAVKSIQNAFKDIPDPIIPVDTAAGDGFGAQQSLTDYYAEMRKVAREMLAIEDADIIEKGDIFIIRVPVFLLFREGVDVVDDRKLFLDVLADSLVTTPVGLQLDLELRMPQAEGVTKQEQELSVRRAGAFARYMVQKGVPENGLYVGLDQALSQMVEIILSPRNVAEHQLRFEGL